MTRTITNEQFNAYLETNGYGISSKNGNVAYVSDAKGNVVAMYWRGETNYLETLDEPIQASEDPINEVREMVTGGALASITLALLYVAIVIFG